jgi:AMMECR1 domain-containing protein
MSDTSKPLFAVSDEYELLALWRLVAEAKFHPTPEDTDIWGSPFVNALSKRVDEAIFERAKRQGLEQERRHLAWRASLERNIFFPAIQQKLRNDASGSLWKTWTSDQKEAHVRGCIAPFEASSALVEKLIHEAEAAAIGRNTAP